MNYPLIDNEISESEMAHIHDMVKFKESLYKDAIVPLSFSDGELKWVFYGKIYSGSCEDDIKKFLDEHEVIIDGNMFRYWRYLNAEGRIKKNPYG